MQSAVVSEEGLGGLEYSGFLCSLLAAVSKEDLITRSPRGQALSPLLESMMNLEGGNFATIALTLVSKCNECLVAGKK